ncbi:hypothetical protein A2962_02130 [Candidatus Woesebacteria bacterium RIFCSPLOWO2_01_FULL_39_61]|uniref:Uncharacterized protein n=1 Tax=Candidatus Woesebacteria bacterium RIFCSPHIGHO2_02_FULL_39_13 TaxID=1802505 RepID=A0A1F7Z3H9_9BACT|nr:MAG: hypothetical protein A2692_01145 [Candidatus Woesebacteria bacterium RIFCSPHIGHO2_01_FULL_39_95]OGM33960.1 MAG: hypothetical protein A3D01_03435 [Candidatus Woesebacteria bacterium RIFCSPHIGHO2_02_FULL_39_13]OGM38218.1 MAG: hypothetical protein A3E13_05545 [Candidatus Woesebacteria bacterium RIFCSPHIGHO2_12_FULL_40_20]OGM66924.1 MAG: hypothetical protein A2962_02130 [Candidatus Woesebacteria bacterium RIFCSPLOWO2_01_FULL_39_61]OGM72320.1 MAG: hypothetical protein A3H19_03420 [Candidatus
MKKRRTRKQKATAKHEFTIRWDPTLPQTKNEPAKDRFEASVKGQFKIADKKGIPQAKIAKTAAISAKSDYLKRIKKDIMRSLTIAALIMGAELVLYLALNA